MFNINNESYIAHAAQLVSLIKENSPAIYGYTLTWSSDDLTKIKTDIEEYPSKEVWKLSIPGADSFEVNVEVDKDKIRVFFDEHVDDTFFTAEDMEYSLQMYHDVRKITSYMERGILHIVIPFKEEYVSDIDVEEKA
jgi:HSP20 family molecular chaperone IbpA